MAAVAAAPAGRDDDLAVKLAFNHLMALDEAFAEGMAAMHACKDVEETKGDGKPAANSRSAHSAAVAPQRRPRSVSTAGPGRAGDDVVFPQYMVRAYVHEARVGGEWGTGGRVGGVGWDVWRACVCGRSGG
jgi:hypothetical protein